MIRGPGVMSGYDGNAQANADAFKDGWFRTRDQGRIDRAGYVTITGRLKELINRGGEKISPREVEEVLLSHPQVQQAVAFAMPHPTLGETVAAAVVVHSIGTLTELQLREFSTARLTYFKVPRRIVFLDEIPKGPTGKVQRTGLAVKLGLENEIQRRAEAVPFVEPRTPLEIKLLGLWRQVLGQHRIGVLDNFFDLGGDSIRAVSLVARVRRDIGGDISLIRFFDRPTIADMAIDVLEKKLEATKSGEKDRLVSEVEQLSEQEAEALLRQWKSPREDR